MESWLAMSERMYYAVLESGERVCTVLADNEADARQRIGWSLGLQWATSGSSVYWTWRADGAKIQRGGA